MTVFHQCIRSAAVALIVSASLAGCVTDDPNRGGFIGGVAGLSSGAYQKGVDDRKKALDDSEDKQIALEREHERRQAQQEALAREMEDLNGKLEALNEDLAAMEAKLNKAKQSGTVDKSRLAELERKMKGLEGEVENEQLTFGDEAVKRERILRLEQKKRAMEAAIEALLAG